MYSTERRVHVLARIHEDASETMRRVRDMMDHSDMFSLDELVCASCKAPAVQMLLFPYLFVIHHRSALQNLFHNEVRKQNGAPGGHKVNSFQIAQSKFICVSNNENRNEIHHDHSTPHRS